MKLYTNKKYNTIALYVLLVVAVSIIMVMGVFRFDGVLRVLNTLIKAFMPIIIGLIFAFLLNPLMKLFERLFKKILCRKKDHSKITRALAITVSVLLFLTMLVGIISIVAPEVVDSLAKILDSTPAAITNIQKWATKTLEDYPEVLNVVRQELSDFSKYWSTISEQIQPMLKNVVDGVWVGVTGVFTYLKNFLLGLIVSIYLLWSKETMLAQVKKLCMANFRKSSCRRFFELCSDSNRIFSGFINGKIIDSIIIGIICFIGMSIFNMEYKVMIAVVIGVTNIIPFFGPFIGAIPCALLVLLSEPHKVIPFLIFILLLQQFDGNILGPKILGDSTGLPAFWVLFAILVGGGLFGFAGMLLGVPTFAVVYNLLRANVNNKLRAKHLPTPTSDYMNDISDMYKRSERPNDYLTPEELDLMNSTSDGGQKTATILGFEIITEEQTGDNDDENLPFDFETAETDKLKNP